MIFNTSIFKKVGFPNEHGSWGFFLEPIILALLISYSLEGLLLSISAFFLFLANQPSSYVIKGKPKYLLPSAYFYLILYFTISSIIIIYLILTSKSIFFLFPFFTAISLMLFFKIMELRNLNRNLIVELIPQFAVVLIAVALLITSKWEISLIIAFIFVVFSRSIQTVFYINNKLKYFKGHKPNKILVNLISTIFVIILAYLAVLNLSPWISVLTILLLTVRSIIGFLKSNKNEKVKTIGIKEFIYGFLFVVINSIGYNFGL